MLCDDLEGCNGVVAGGKSNGEGISMSIELTHFVYGRINTIL